MIDDKAQAIASMVMLDKHLTVTLPQFPSRSVLIAHFKGVQNGREIKEQLVAANARYNYSFIDASMVVTVEQLLSSAYKTLLDESQGKMKSKTINSELILNLSPFTGIADSFKKIGISESTTNLIAVRFLQADDVDERLAELGEVVAGETVPIDNAHLPTDFAKVRKVFKLNSILSKDEEQDREKISRIIIGITQLK